MTGEIISINLSDKKGIAKTPVKIDSEVELKENFGIVGDAHSGSEREVSLLGLERIHKWIEQKSTRDLRIKPGDFAENITTEGIDWSEVKIGDKIEIQNGIVLEVTQIGKPCHSACNIRKLVGDCLMPKEGVFAKVLTGGKIKIGDVIKVSAER